MYLDSMIFPIGLEFIFGSWIWKVDGNDKLQSYPFEDTRDDEELNDWASTMDQLAKNFFSHHGLRFFSTRLSLMVFEGSPICGVLLSRVQGLMMTTTMQGYIVHWSGSITKDNNPWLVDATTTLSFQVGDPLYDSKEVIEILNNLRKN
jgi:hypothetical protein